MKKRSILCIVLILVLLLTGCNSNSSGGLEKKGLKAYNSGNTEEAIGFFQEAEQLGELSEEGKNTMADSLCAKARENINAGQYEEAISNFEESEKYRALSGENVESLREAYSLFGENLYENTGDSETEDAVFAEYDKALSYLRRIETLSADGELNKEEKNLCSRLLYRYMKYLKAEENVLELKRVIRAYNFVDEIPDYPSFMNYDSEEKYRTDYGSYKKAVDSSTQYDKTVAAPLIVSCDALADLEENAKHSIAEAEVGDHVIISYEDWLKYIDVVGDDFSEDEFRHMYETTDIVDLPEGSWTVLEKEDGKALLVFDVPIAKDGFIYNEEEGLFAPEKYHTADITRGEKERIVTNPQDTEYAIELGFYDSGKKVKLLTYEEYEKYKDIIGNTIPLYVNDAEEKLEGKKHSAFEKWYLPDENTHVEVVRYTEWGYSKNNRKMLEPNHQFVEKTVVGGKVINIYSDSVYDYNEDENGFTYRVIAEFEY